MRTDEWWRVAGVGRGSVVPPERLRGEDRRRSLEQPLAQSGPWALSRPPVAVLSPARFRALGRCSEAGRPGLAHLDVQLEIVLDGALLSLLSVAAAARAAADATAATKIQVTWGVRNIWFLSASDFRGHEFSPAA